MTKRSGLEGGDIDINWTCRAAYSEGTG